MSDQKPAKSRKSSKKSHEKSASKSTSSKGKKSSSKSKRKKEDDDFIVDGDEVDTDSAYEEEMEKKPKKIRKLQHGTANLFSASNTDKLKKLISQIVSGLKKTVMQKNDFILIFENLTYISKEIRSNNYGLIREHDREARRLKFNLLWNELLGYTEKFAEISENHRKIFSTMESLNPLGNIVELPQKDDPEAYRYTPKYKYAIMTEPPKSYMDDKEKKYAEKSFREVANPSALLSMNPKGLQYMYWSRFNESRREFPFSGYPKGVKAENEQPT